MILGLSMKARMGLSKFIVIIPKTTFGVLNFVVQQAREGGPLNLCKFFHFPPCASKY